MKEPFFEPFKKDCFLPILGFPNDRRYVGTRYGGRPSRTKLRDWPRCGACKKSMTFLFQIDLAELDLEQKRTNLVQLFMCASDRCALRESAHINEPFSPGTRVIISPEDSRKMSEEGFPNDIQEVPNLFVVADWKRISDYPNLIEMETLGLAAPVLGRGPGPVLGRGPRGPGEAIYRFRGENVNQEVKDLQKKTSSGDKALGWPVWIQEVEYPHCETCQKPMELLYQIVDQLFIDFGFSPGAAGFLFWCSEHGKGTFMCQG